MGWPLDSGREIPSSKILTYYGGNWENCEMGEHTKNIFVTMKTLRMLRFLSKSDY